MDEQQGQEQGREYRESEEPTSPSAVVIKDKEDGSKSSELHENEPPYIREHSKKSRWKRFMDAGVDRFIELFLATSITVFALGQWMTTCQNNASTSGQTSQLIQQAKINACAAQSFAASAGHINDGVNHAVTQLQGQITQMKLIQRPWVAFVENSITPASKPGYSSGVVTVVTLKGDLINIGNTPAEDVKVDFAIQIWRLSQVSPKVQNTEKRNVLLQIQGYY